MAAATRRRKPPGASPGTMVLTGDAVAPRIHLIRYTFDSIEELDLQPAETGRLRETGAPGAVTWIDVQGLGDLELLRSLGEIFALHPLALEDVVSLRQRGKVDDYDSHLFVITRMPEAGEEVSTDQTSLFLGPGFLITFQERHGDCLEPVRERLRRGKGLMRRSGADYLAYAIIDAIIDAYFPLLESYGESLEALEDEIVDRPGRGSLERVHRCKHDLLLLRRAVWPMRDMLSSLVREESDLVAAQTRVYLRDCYDHTVQILDIVETYRELAAGLMDIYISSLSQKLNEVMKVLTIIATIFIPLTLVTGVYGMNFDHMPELHWRFGYPAVMGLMAVAALCMVWYFARRGWIGPADLPSRRGARGRRRARGRGAAPPPARGGAGRP